MFTGIPGKFVQIEDTVASFKAVVDGEYDHLPESAFYMVGGIEEAVAKAEKLAAGGLMQMADLHFELVTPEKLLRSEDVHMVVVPGTEGDFGVMAGHAPYMSTLARRRARHLPHRPAASPSGSRSGAASPRSARRA